jgi:hypothetical protein
MIYRFALNPFVNAGVLTELSALESNNAKKVALLRSYFSTTTKQSRVMGRKDRKKLFSCRQPACIFRKLDSGAVLAPAFPEFKAISCHWG